MSQAKPNRDQVGIACPRCCCRHFYTTHTEPLRDGRIRRRKLCRHCGRRLLTFETAFRSTPAATSALQLSGSVIGRQPRPQQDNKIPLSPSD